MLNDILRTAKTVIKRGITVTVKNRAQRRARSVESREGKRNWKKITSRKVCMHSLLDVKSMTAPVMDPAVKK